MFKIRIYSQVADTDTTNVTIIRDIPSLADAYIICKSVCNIMSKDAEITGILSDVINTTTREVIM